MRLSNSRTNFVLNWLLSASGYNHYQGTKEDKASTVSNKSSIPQSNTVTILDVNSKENADADEDQGVDLSDMLLEMLLKRKVT